MAEFDSTYQSASLRGPELDDLRQMDAELKLMCTENQLQDMAEMAKDMDRSYQTVMKMADPTLAPVIYPRTPGYRPAPEDNPYNAWAWRCDIPGSPSGKLAGRRLGIKDSVAVAGVPMRCGSRLLQHYVPESDATVVTRILHHGGRIVGKTAVEDLCFTCSNVFNIDGPTRNPWDESRIAGGSSSGSAALVASGHVDMAVGGDQGGSIRAPASWSGIVGLKPTWGLVPYTGAVHMDPTVDHLGPMTKTVTDCALLLEVMAGYDGGRDPRQFPTMSVPEYSKLIEQDVRGRKIGILKEGFELCSEEAVPAVVREAAQTLTQAGCSLHDISVPLHKHAGAVFSMSVGYGSYKCFIESAECSKGVYSTSMDETIRRGLKACPQDLPPLVKFEMMCQRYVDRHYGASFHGKARNVAFELGRRYDAALEEVDVLLMPTVPHTAPKIPPAGASFPDLAKHCWSGGGNTMAFNLTGHPAITINAGFSPPDPERGRGKLPIGMMIVGKQFDETTVLSIARAFEKLSRAS